MGMGVFSPQNVDQSLLMLDMMDFDGKEQLITKLQQMGTMADMLAYFEQIALSLAQQYDPELAEQIAGMIMQTAQTQGQEVPNQGAVQQNEVRQDSVTGNLTREHANGPKARGLVNEATKPR